MIHAAERYSQSALFRALIRVFDAAEEEGFALDELPDDLPTDLRDADEEPLTLGCLIEEIEHIVGNTDDDGETIVRDEVPAEFYVSRQDAIAAWKIGKRIDDDDETVTDEEAEFAADVAERKAAYRKHLKAQRRQEAAEADGDEDSETDTQAALRRLRAQGFVVTKAKPAEVAEAERGDEEETETEKPSKSSRIAEALRKRGMRRRSAETETEAVAETTEAVAEAPAA